MKVFFKAFLFHIWHNSHNLSRHCCVLRTRSPEILWTKRSPYQDANSMIASIPQQLTKTRQCSRVFWLNITSGYENNRSTCSDIKLYIVPESALSRRSWARMTGSHLAGYFHCNTLISIHAMESGALITSGCTSAWLLLQKFADPRVGSSNWRTTT